MQNQILAGKESVQTAVAAIGCGLCLGRGGGFARKKTENCVVRTARVETEGQVQSPFVHTWYLKQRLEHFESFCNAADATAAIFDDLVLWAKSYKPLVKHRMAGDGGAGALPLPEQREKAGEMGMKQEEPWTDACAAASFKMLQIDLESETKAAQNVAP